jgi:AcrR family transcriptional regulator
VARKAGLERAQVVATAAALADRDGLAALTLTQVAHELGIRPPSVYAHVDGLDGLHRALRTLGAHTIARELADAADGRAGRDALRAFAFAYRRFAREHPGLYEATLRGADPAEDPELAGALAEPVGVIVAALGDLGVTGDEALHAVRIWRSALHGFVDLERRGGFGLPLDLDATFARLVDAIGDLPAPVASTWAAPPAQPRRPSSATASRSSINSATLASMRTREKSSRSSPPTTDHSPRSVVHGKDDTSPSGTP